MNKFRWLSVAVATILFITPLIANAQLVPDLVVSRTQGFAPLGVHFDATGTTHNGDPAWDTHLYQFDFGDDSSAAWETTGNSKNTHSGAPLTAHVYETPGVYTVEMRVGNQLVTRTIEVISPDEFFPSDKTVCLSMTGNFSGCPSGAQQITNSIPDIEQGHRYLLRAGQNFSSLGDINTKDKQDVLIDRFGSGADPTINGIFVQAGSRRYEGDQWARNVVVNNLRAGFAVQGMGADYVMFHNIEIYDNGSSDPRVESGANLNYYNGRGFYDTANGTSLVFPKNIFFVNIKNVNLGQEAFGSGQMVWMGNEFCEAWEHNIRLWQAHKTVVANNKLCGHISDEELRPGRANLKFHAAGLLEQDISGQFRPGMETKYVAITENLLNDPADQHMWVNLSMKPQNSDEVEGVGYVIMERNTGYEGTRPNFKSHAQLGGKELTVINSTYIVNGQSATPVIGTSNNVAQLPSEWDGPYNVFQADPRITPNGSPDLFNDSDGDGIEDSLDNCPSVPNSDQSDTDADGIGNVCDTPDTIVDADGDGVSDEVDNCPMISNPGQSDVDGNGIGDLCDDIVQADSGSTSQWLACQYLRVSPTLACFTANPDPGKEPRWAECQYVRVDPFLECLSVE